MATVYITLKIMPESPETDLDKLEEQVKTHITDFKGNFGNSKQEPVAFGLKALMVTFSANEDLGGTDKLEEEISSIEEVQSVQVTDVRRAIG